MTGFNEELHDQRIADMKARERRMEPYMLAMLAYQADDQENRNTERLAAYKRKRGEHETMNNLIDNATLSRP